MLDFINPVYAKADSDNHWPKNHNINGNEVVRNFKHYADKYQYPTEKADVLLVSFSSGVKSSNL
jgi:hypothetical protein